MIDTGCKGTRLESRGRKVTEVEIKNEKKEMMDGKIRMKEKEWVKGEGREGVKEEEVGGNEGGERDAGLKEDYS